MEMDRLDLISAGLSGGTVRWLSDWGEGETTYPDFTNHSTINPPWTGKPLENIAASLLNCGGIELHERCILETHLHFCLLAVPWAARGNGPLCLEGLRPGPAAAPCQFSVCQAKRFFSILFHLK